MLPEQHSRTVSLIGADSLATLSRARVAVFGIGGVGSYVAEALARAGVGALDLIDSDTVSVSNINRQIVALHSTVGQSKVEVMARRIHDINPDCTVRTYPCFYLPETAERSNVSAVSGRKNTSRVCTFMAGLISNTRSAITCVLRFPIVECKAII